MLSIATFNLYNLGTDATPKRLENLTAIILQTLQAPDILAVQEIKATDAANEQGWVPADATYQMMIAAISAAGGPRYDFREIPPLVNRDGGQPGSNIRVGLLFNPQQVEFVDRGKASPEQATGIRFEDGRPALTLNPGRIAPAHPAFSGDPKHHWLPSRKALVGEFRCQDERFFVIVCHFKSMRALTRRDQDYAKKQRQAQAQLIYGFVSNLLACDPGAKVVVLGDMNDVTGSKTLKILKGNLLSNLLEQVPRGLCYSRRHGRRAQALDHILVSHALQGTDVRIPHVNCDNPDPERASDHDPVVAILGPKPASLSLDIIGN